MSLNFALFDFLFPSFLDGSDSKVYSCNSGDPGLIPGSERSPAEGNGNPLQYSCLDNSMDRGAWQATLMGLQRVRHHWTTNTTPTSLFINWNSTIKNNWAIYLFILVHTQIYLFYFLAPFVLHLALGSSFKLAPMVFWHAPIIFLKHCHNFWDYR